MFRTSEFLRIRPTLSQPTGVWSHAILTYPNQYFLGNRRTLFCLLFRYLTFPKYWIEDQRKAHQLTGTTLSD